MDEHQFDPASDSLDFPVDTVVGIVDEPEAASAAVEALVAEGIPEASIQVLCCDSGARRLDPSGKRHGVLGRIKRIVQLFADQEVEHLKRQAAELRDGNFVIAAPAADEGESERVAQILKSHGGHFINYYRSWTVQRLEA